MIRWKSVKGDSLGIENAYRLDSLMNDGKYDGIRYLIPEKYLGYIFKDGKSWVSIIDDEETGQEVEMLHSTKSQAKKRIEDGAWQGEVNSCSCDRCYYG